MDAMARRVWICRCTLCTVIGAALLAAGCVVRPAPGPDRSLSPTLDAAATRVPDAWEYLRRPMLAFRPPPCEPASARTLSDKFAPGAGGGPVYAVGSVDGVFAISHWKENGLFGIKVLWVAPPSFVGRVLVRGSGSDGVRVRFNFSQELDSRIEWRRPSDGEWRESPSSVWVPGPGCYQWQVDFDAGTRLIVFEVVGGP
jgi:hypothetical protein